MDRIKSKNNTSTKARRPLVKVFAAASVFVFAVFLFLNYTNINNRQEKLNEINANIEMQKIENDKLENEIKNSDDAEYIERIAREKYGYVRAGDRVYVNTK